jgi:hypothetical protein
MTDTALEERIMKFLGGAKSGDAAGMHGHTILHVFNGYQTWKHFKDLIKCDESEHRILVTDGYTASLFSCDFIFNGQIYFPPGSLIVYNKNHNYAGVQLSSPDGKMRFTISTPPNRIYHERYPSSENPAYGLHFFHENPAIVEPSGASLIFKG